MCPRGPDPRLRDHGYRTNGSRTDGSRLLRPREVSRTPWFEISLPGPFHTQYVPEPPSVLPPPPEPCPWVTRPTLSSSPTILFSLSSSDLDLLWNRWTHGCPSTDRVVNLRPDPETPPPPEVYSVCVDGIRGPTYEEFHCQSPSSSYPPPYLSESWFRYRVPSRTEGLPCLLPPSVRSVVGWTVPGGRDVTGGTTGTLWEGRKNG